MVWYPVSFVDLDFFISDPIVRVTVHYTRLTVHFVARRPESEGKCPPCPTVVTPLGLARKIKLHIIITILQTGADFISCSM